MAINPENEDALKAVDSILANANTEKTCFSVKLPLDTARDIAFVLYVKIPLARFILHEDAFGEEREGLMARTKDKFCQVAKLPHRGVVEGISDMSICLSAEEVDFLNGIYLESIGFIRQAGREDWYSEPEEQSFRDMIAPSMQEDMSNFVILNRAFIKAGGIARPEFTRMLG